MFLAYVYLFLFLGGDFIFSLVGACGVVQTLLYLGASLCIFPFSSCHIVFTLLSYSCQGEYILCFLFSNFLLIYDYEFFIIICLYCLCLKSRFLFFFFTCIFFHTCGYAFCLSVSGNIQVDSIKLLSTLATNGQQLGLNLCF